MSTGWIGVDLDATLARSSGPITELIIGDPVPDMADRVRCWISAGEDVRIFTARVDSGKGAREMGFTPFADVDLNRRVIQDWTEKHFGLRLPVTNEKDCAMKELWDDRAVRVIANTGKIDSFEQLPVRTMIIVLGRKVLGKLRDLAPIPLTTGRRVLNP